MGDIFGLFILELDADTFGAILRFCSQKNRNDHFCFSCPRGYPTYYLQTATKVDGDLPSGIPQKTVRKFQKRSEGDQKKRAPSNQNLVVR